MIFFILVALVILVCTFNWFDSDYFIDAVIGIIFVPFIGAALFFLIAFFAPASGYIESEPTSLKALRTSSESSGSFFLGSGYIDSEHYIYFIAENSESGPFSLESVEASNSLIYEDDSATPHVITVTGMIDHWWLAPFSLPSYESYKFVVPSGSVSNGFDVSP